MIRSMMALAGLLLAWPVLAGEPQCPQPRFTGTAPAAYLALENPIALNRAVLREGRKLYLGKSDNRGCAICHGSNGDGRGPLAASFDPPPRNFTCARTVNDIPDGQLFWIIRYGSPDTSMPAHPELRDSQIWQLVHELRRLAR